MLQDFVVRSSLYEDEQTPISPQPEADHCIYLYYFLTSVKSFDASLFETTLSVSFRELSINIPKLSMLKRINIKSILQAKDTLSDSAFNEFLDYFGIGIREAEIEDLRYLSIALSDIGCEMRDFDRYFLGYKIPQIGKEFDLLRLGKNHIVNIELKSENIPEKIKNQLIRNKYYLSSLGIKIYTFTFASSSKEFYFLKDNGELNTVGADYIKEILATQEIDESENLDVLFDPSDYLVSPFNSTKKFLSNEYFLTLQQEDVRIKIIELIKESTAAKFISIIGSAGTGKTLLTYDIAKRIIENGKKPIIIHCGQLNDGHLNLIDRGWRILSIKSYKDIIWSNNDIVIVDEAQRIYERQLKDIIATTIALKCCCIFSHDKRQTLAGWEAKRDMSGKIAAIPSITQFKLSEKIRTNKEIASFIKMLFNRKRTLPISNSNNIEFNFFNSTEDAKKYIENLDKSKWEILRFTPSLYNNEHHEKYADLSSSTSHRVIGQEFDDVVVTIDQYFSYDANGDLIYNGNSYYDLPKMLFQNISRCRKRLNLVIIKNSELLSRCITILK